MAEEGNQTPNDQGTMAGNLKEKPGDATSFGDQQYAGEQGPVTAGTGSSAGGTNVSTQGGGSGSSKQGGNTGSSTSGSR